MTTPVTLALPPTVVIAPTGVQGVRGNTVLSGSGAPAAGVGINGDYYIDVAAYPTTVTLYGPKSGGAWPGSGVTIGGGGGTAGALLAINNLSDVQSAAAARTNLGLGSAALLAANTFDAAGAAAAAQDAAIADAAAKYRRLQPWVFDITDARFGAVGDAKIVTDGAVTLNVATLTCGTSAPFTSADVGKVVLIQGAGTFGVSAFKAVLTAYNGPGSMGLSVAPPTSISGAIVVYGTNNYTAIRAANQAASDYRAAGHAYSEVYTPVGGFILDGPLDTSLSGNSLVPFGVDATTGQKKTPAYRGEGGAAVRHWEQTVPQISGSTWISFSYYSDTSAQSNDITAHGNPAIIGGPNEGPTNGLAYGVGTAQGARFSNTMPMVSDMAFLTPHTAFGLTHGAINFYGCAAAHIRNVSVSTLGVVPSPTDYVSPGQFATGLCAAVLMPAPGNNDLSLVDNLSIQGGFTYGIFFSEHTLITRIMVLYCWAALVAVGTYAGSVGAVHEMRILSASVEACTHELYVMGPGSEGVGPTVDIHLSTESSTPNIAGSAGSLMAAIGKLTLTGLYNKANVSTASPCGIQIVNGQDPAPIARKTGAFTCTPIDRVLMCDTTAGAFTATLPDADVNPVEYVLRNTGGNTLTVAAIGGQLIYPTGSNTGATTAAVAPGNVLRVRATYNGTAWAWYAV